MKPFLIDMRNIVKSYYVNRENELEIIHSINLKIAHGDFVAIVGESGSGKSTLMNMIGVLTLPTSGHYTLDGVDVSHMSGDEMGEIRNRKIGFVFQNFNLISKMTALENVELPMVYAGEDRKERKKRAKRLLELVGMQERMSHKPNELSGGQKQRVAIARSLANNPGIILADEPTGALDSETGQSIMKIFHKLHDRQKTIIIVTHNEKLAQECSRIITIRDGNIIEDVRGRNEF